MSQFQLLAQLLPYLERYERKIQGQDVAVPAFAQWLSDEMLYDRQFYKVDTQRLNDETKTDDSQVVVGKMIYYLYRYSRHYTRKALQNHVLNSQEEFTFLVTLMNFNQLTKTDLIHRVVYEKTSGLEIINRLIGKGLMAEIDNPTDKRSKHIHVTDYGRGMLYQSFEQMGKVADILRGNLSAEELTTLLHLLDKLDQHHAQIWTAMKDSTLDEILAARSHEK